MKTYIDPRGIEYGMLEISLAGEAYTVRHTRDGYTFTLNGSENFTRWSSAIGLRKPVVRFVCFINETHDCSESVTLNGSAGEYELGAVPEVVSEYVTDSERYDLLKQVVQEMNDGATAGQLDGGGIAVAWEIVTESENLTC